MEAKRKRSKRPTKKIAEFRKRFEEQREEYRQTVLTRNRAVREDSLRGELANCQLIKTN
jgi:hypothetical protein